jgi:hypothetical protein
MCQRTSYQIFDRSPISAVTIKVKPSPYCSSNPKVMSAFPNYNCTQSSYDVNDFILPATENSAVSITTRITEVGHILRSCDNTDITEQNEYSPSYPIAIHNCHNKSSCILPPSYRDVSENKTNISKPQLCWFKLRPVHVKRNYQALDYILFIKNWIEFPQLHLIRDNLLKDVVGEDYMKTCEYDSNNKLCPKFRISTILELIEGDPNEYESMFYNGSLMEIKISWQCNLDKDKENCQPQYAFQRLDYHPYKDNPYELGSSFLTSRHFFRPNDQKLHRIHTHVYNLHIVVSVTGEVGKRDLFQATTSIGSFLGIIAAGTITCDFIAAFFTNLKSVKYDS